MYKTHKNIILREKTLEDIYNSLGFKKTVFIKNSYGIRIYIGTKGKEDWCIVIPNRLAKIKAPKWKKDYVVYLTSEEEVLRIAEEFTKLAKERESYKISV